MTIDKNVEAALVAGAHKELAYLEQFGQPLLPFRRWRREGYQYQEQSPSSHVENLNRYLLTASSLVPRNPVLSHFCIRHPDVQQGNIILSKSADSDWKIISLIDWQRTPILPLFTIAGVPHSLENYDDPVSQSMTYPSLPEDFDEYDENKRARAEEMYRRRLVHYHYLTNMEKYNEPHYAVETDSMYVLRRRLFYQSSEWWRGETLDLKTSLIRAMEKWEALTGGGVPCPLVFDADEVQETIELNELQTRMDGIMKKLRDALGMGVEGWVPIQNYEGVMACSKEMKTNALDGVDTAKEREETMNNWPFDDMDEEKYM